ncbi:MULTISPECIES: hypothetical protein [Laceyella]|jgi:hypothetical protein|uniref:Uncharacterized protein n=1 Tax=Laceyella sediminis TaxID=573074 RepID=A0ABX5EQZ9_9BACL|nr:hypothetical protein [Laceyella sediminis]MRG28334.1 hypothetical protein [Laceyella tengchongensis]PRZ14337.1 hypothetical protein CLV36_10699 [Laceyella sediminis]
MELVEKQLYRVFSHSQSLLGQEGLYCMASDAESARHYFIEQSITAELKQNRSYYLTRFNEAADFVFAEVFVKQTPSKENQPTTTCQLCEMKVKEWFHPHEEWALLYLKYQRGEVVSLPEEMVRFIVKRDILHADAVYIEKVDFVEID